MKTNRIFQDDPDAIERLEAKLVKLEEEKAYWKTIKKCVPRDYSNTPEDARWYMLTNVTTRIREVNKKIEKIRERQEAGITLQRKPTYQNGRKNFYYEEVPHKTEGYV